MNKGISTWSVLDEKWQLSILRGSAPPEGTSVVVLINSVATKAFTH